MNPKVFILEPCRFDISASARHGDMVYVFAENSHRSSIFQPEFPAQLITRLAELRFVPARDYFVCTGAIGSIAIAIAAMLAAFGRVRLLIYSGTDDMYLPMEFANASLSAENLRDGAGGARADIQPPSGVAPIFGSLPESRRVG